MNCPLCNMRLKVDDSRNHYGYLQIRKYKCTNDACGYKTTTDERLPDITGPIPQKQASLSN